MAAATEPYAALADVKARVPSSVWSGGAGSEPSATEVTAWLAAASAWIDGTLRWKYAIPVDALDAPTLKQICALLVAAQVWEVIGGHSVQQPANGDGMRRLAWDLLAYLPREGRSYIMLPNSPLADDGEAALGQPHSTLTDPLDTTNPPRWFTRSMEF